MEKREGYKKTPLGWIPEEWEAKSLQEVALINPKKINIGKDDMKVSFIRMSDVSETARLIKYSEKEYKEVSNGYTSFIDSDILVAKITPCFENGKGAIVKGLINGIGFGSTEFHVIRPKKNTCTEFLYFHTISQSFREKGKSNMIGSAGQKRVPADFVKSFNIPVPPLPEQKKIAAILSTVDEKIESIETEIDAAQQLKKGLMQQLLTRGIGHREFKETKIGTIPKEWEVVLLDSVAKRGSGHTPNRKISEYWNGGIKWVSLADTKRLDRLFINDTEYEISEEGIRNSSAITHKKGTVIISRDAGVGKSSIINCEMAVSQHFMAWECFDKLNNVFLYYLLQSWKTKFETIADGTTIKTIGLGYFKNFIIPLPTIDEQKKIVEILVTLDEKLDILREKKEGYQALKKGLMQQLLTGNLRVSVDFTENEH
jgi:type I restriction enzyme S subunit